MQSQSMAACLSYEEDSMATVPTDDRELHAKSLDVAAAPHRSIAAHFTDLPDPRVNRRKRHRLSDILTIALCAVLCGADDFVEIELFGRLKRDWFQERLDLPNGIPSHDTFTRVFAQLDPDAFREGFLSWIEAVKASLATTAEQRSVSPEQIAIDGKTLRHSFEAGNVHSAIHMVSAWAHQSGLVLAQLKVDGKSNEITAVPELLKRLDIAGCIVSMDAMHCQKETVRQIVEQEGDYVVGLKGNQENLHEAVALFFDDALKQDFVEPGKDGPTIIQHVSFQEQEKDHGRIETRKCTVVSAEPHLTWLDPDGQWKGLASIVLIESERRTGRDFENVTTERRFYISSLPGHTKKDARRLARAVRHHWGIENSLHWVLDIAFREDENRTRKHHGPENLATLRHIAYNLLKRDKTTKAGVKARRHAAGWDNDYLAQLIGI
jgi:predicted transposase YbfD/YdcC